MPEDSPATTSSDSWIIDGYTLFIIIFATGYSFGIWGICSELWGRYVTEKLQQRRRKNQDAVTLLVPPPVPVTPVILPPPSTKSTQSFKMTTSRPTIYDASFEIASSSTTGSGTSSNGNNSATGGKKRRVPGRTVSFAGEASPILQRGSSRKSSGLNGAYLSPIMTSSAESYPPTTISTGLDSHQSTPDSSEIGSPLPVYTTPVRPFLSNSKYTITHRRSKIIIATK